MDRQGARRPLDQGEPAGEIALVPAYAGHLGVPVGLVTGDVVACREARELLPGVETVGVKRAVDRSAAEISLPEATLPAIREAA